MKESERKISLTSELPILIDTRKKEFASFKKINQELNLYKFDSSQKELNECFADW